MHNAAVAVPAAATGPGGGPGRARVAAVTAALATVVTTGLTGLATVLPAPGAVAQARAGAAVPRDPEPPAPEAAERPQQAPQPQPQEPRQQPPEQPQPQPRQPQPRPVAKRAKPLAMRFAVPTRIRIPSIRVNAPLTRIDVDRRGRLQVPPLNRPNLAGWYVGSASPGQVGPAVIVGHMDTRTGPAVFYRLRTIKPGARVYVDRRDGSTAVFQVRRRVRVPKTAFPTEKVYGDIGNSGLRLITCGGAFDDRTRHYRDNVIVFARLVRAVTPRSA